MRIYDLSQPDKMSMCEFKLLRCVFFLFFVLCLTFPAGSVFSAEKEQKVLSAEQQAAICVGKNANTPIAINKGSYPNTASIIKDARAHAESGKYLEALALYNYADDVVDIEKEPIIKRKILLEKENIHKAIDQICERRLQELEQQQAQTIKELYERSSGYFRANKLVEAETGFKEILALDMDHRDAQNYLDNLIPLRAEEIKKQRQPGGEGVALAAAPVDSRGGQGSAPAQPLLGEASNGVTVKGFRLVGNASVPSADLQTSLSEYLNKFCDYKMLNQAADRVSAEYDRRGLNFAKAYILAQDIENGVVEITVVEGRLGEIQVEGNKNYSADFIRGFMKASAAGTSLTSEGLERGLLLLNSEFTDLKVTADLEPGKEPGTVGVRAKVDDRLLPHLTLYANNYGQENVSRYRYGGQIEWANALIPGALLTVGGYRGYNPDNMAYGNGMYVVPVNYRGTKVGIHVASGSFTVGRDFADLGMYGKELSGGIFVTHPFIKSRTSSLYGTLGYRSTDAKFYLLDEVSSYDKVRVVYAEVGGDQVIWGGKSFASFNVTQGLGDLNGGTQGDDPQTSRIHADNDFSRFSLNFAHQQPLGAFFSALLRLSGQWSSQSLLASEEWQVGGVDSVRGYSPGEATGDYGYRSSLEFRVAPLQNKEILQLATFIDYGYAYRREPLAGAKETSELTGAGLGLYSHMTTSFVTADLRLDVGWPVKPTMNFLNEDPVVYFSVSTRF